MNQFQYYNVNVDDDLTIPCHQQNHAAPGVHRSLNRSLYQAGFFDAEGRSCGDLERCVVPPTARAAADSPICAGESVLLDGASSTGCTSGLSYRWTDDGGRVVCDWSASSLCAVEPDGTTLYTLTVACEEDEFCRATAGITVEVLEGPVAEAGPDRVICPRMMFAALSLSQARAKAAFSAVTASLRTPLLGALGSRSAKAAMSSGPATWARAWKAARLTSSLFSPA